MAEKSFYLEIITPRRIVFKGEVVSISVPGVVGGFQVLKNHAALLSSLNVGEVKLTDGSGNEFHFATSGGFVEVHDNSAVLLAETAERADEIDIERAKSARERAKKRLEEKEATLDPARATLALQRAQNRLHIAAVK
ncbi:MAG TPA: F0F1 ATP synthase subunit epsilon [Bacteroidota bacterium]|nr:F0F1 ATP synthase subunit epsilon [Bacteroidota bacterium]